MADILQLRRSQLVTLVALTDPDAVVENLDADDLEQLRAIGLVEGLAVPPAVVPLATAVGSPIVLLQLDFLGPHRKVSCSGWIDSQLAVLAVPGPTGLDEIKVAPTPFLPARLAGFLGLGPHPISEWSWQGSRADLGSSLGDVGSKPGAEPHAPGRMPFVPAERLRLHWRAGMAWQGGARSMEVVDSLDGFWLVSQDAGDSDTSLVPACATDVWVGLIGLFRQDDELGQLGQSVT